MDNEKAAQKLTQKLEKVLRKKMGPLFERYGVGIEDLLTPLKGKPLVLIIGNYSSGKSTFINELLGSQVQRTGHAPTDDSFTILSYAEPGLPEEEIPGSTVVNDENLPFSSLRSFGESLISHLRLKYVNSDILKELSIIDTPGMLDSVTEKDRGYNYLGVVGELAKLADLIILMFDPHKAGTIKETYEAIRSTLPGATGEDRVLYVMNRIDECDNVADLVRTYGTLCWNLSQMTGRKDMPRIFVTFSPEVGHSINGYDIWTNEREELKRAVGSATRMRLNHIYQEVDRIVRELSLASEAMASFKQRFAKNLKGVLRITCATGLFLFFFSDLAMNLLTGYPQEPLVGALLNGNVSMEHFVWPLASFLLVMVTGSLYVNRWLFPKLTKQSLADLESLVTLDSAYKKDLWRRVRGTVYRLLSEQARRQIWIPHNRNRHRIENFLERDMRKFFERIQESRL